MNVCWGCGRVVYPDQVCMGPHPGYDHWAAKVSGNVSESVAVRSKKRERWETEERAYTAYRVRVGVSV